MIEVNKVSKYYQQADQEIKALEEVSFQLATSETLSITGSSGSGKTTLLTLLAGLDTPDSGNIKLFEKDIFNLKENELGHFRGEHIGIVFQKFHLMPYLTALENVSLPLEIAGVQSAKELSAEALGQVGLTHRLGHKPSELSGGESQRVAIARAVVTKPKLILADEPSGNLDSKTGEVIVDLLFKLTESIKSTMILITHDDQLAARCKKQIRLNAGQLESVR